MNNNIQEIWEKSLEIIKPELTEISYTTWVLPITPVSLNVETNEFMLSIYNSFSKDILQTRYSSLIKNAVSQVTGLPLNIVFVNKQEDYPQEEEKPVKKEVITETENLSLNPKYTFDTFVIGNSNRFAHAAALAVAEAPAKAYNPLFLYGGVGLGKTHLMHAIGHYIHKNKANAKILYVSSEKFTNELINAIKDDKNKKFRDKFRSIDILLIDDIQFIAGKERTQEEFFHTFNTLYEDNKQIILSSDRPPKAIPTLEDRLRSRFEWGLIADVQAPDYETRVAILRKKAEIDGLNLNDELTEVIEFIAEKIQSNIRELEGAFNRIIAYSGLINKRIDISIAKEALKDVFEAKNKQVTPKLIKSTISDYFNIKISDLESQKRSKNIVYPRQLAMYICRELTDLSFPKIGEYFGNRDHTTVLHSCDKITKERKNNDSVNDIINKLINEIKSE